MIPVVLGAIAVAASAALLNRRRVRRSVEAAYESRFPRSYDGIAVGADGFVLEGSNGKRLLLLHGSGDTPQSLRYLAERLNAAGFTVHAPLLPGHGRSPRAFAMATASEYHAAASAALVALEPSREWVAVVGLSMGGALAARIVTENAGVRALVLLAPYVIPPRGVRVVRGTSWLWRGVAPYLLGRGDASVHDPAASDASRAYGSFSAGALEALTATADAGYRALPALRLPLLVINSAKDNRIPRALAEQALRAIATPMEQHWLDGCGHVITVDYCKDEVASLVVAFLARHAG